jgi:hypothetical protein
MLGAGGGAGATVGTGRLGLLLLLRIIRVMLTADVAMVLYKEPGVNERKDVQKRKVCMREKEGVRVIRQKRKVSTQATDR